MATQQHVIDLIPAYALGVLDPQESSLVVEHVAVCAECNQELAAFERTTSQLALAAPEHTPRPMLKQRLMERTKPAAAPPAPAPAKPSWWQRFNQMLAMPILRPAALLLILGLGAINLLLLRQVNQLTQTLNAVDESYVVALAGTEENPDAVGRLFIASDGQQATLVVDGLSPLAATQQYQLWLIEGDQPVSAGVFSVDRTGEASVQVPTDEVLLDYSVFAVSIEPSGGSASPTGAVVLMGNFQQ